MPKVYEYLGIVIRFFSDEHDPIHIHAIYNGISVKVAFYIKDGKISRITYTETYGKFPPSKMQVLKEFVSKYKQDIVEKWQDYFIWHKKIKAQIITKKI